MTTNNNTNVISWFDYLPYDVRLHFTQCRTTKADIPILLEAKWQWAKNSKCYNSFTKEDILAGILRLLDRKNLASITKLTTEEWRNLTK